MKKSSKASEQTTPDKTEEIVEVLSKLVSKYGKKPEKTPKPEPIVLNPDEAMIDQLTVLISTACENGDNVSAIADRTGISRSSISEIRNGRYESSPSLDAVERILHALGYKLVIKKT